MRGEKVGDLHTVDVRALVHLERGREGREAVRSLPRGIMERTGQTRHKFQGFYFVNSVDLSVKTESRTYLKRDHTFRGMCPNGEKEQKAGGKRGKNEICGT